MELANESKIVNKSSEEMAEIKNKSVNLIVAGPPYNIGTTYGENDDSTPHQEYVKMLEKVFSECERVLKDNGVLIVEAADTIYSNNLYIGLSALIAKIVNTQGLKINNRIVNYVKSSKGLELPDHDWSDSFDTNRDGHSNCHQIQFFSKENGFQGNGEVWYINYPEGEEGHPCPFNQEVIKRVLDMSFKEGFTVLDPFAGTARLGEEVVKRGGVFIGYEKEAAFCDTAIERLSK